jgi:hypothetical protein
MRCVFFMHRDLAGNLTELIGSDGYMLTHPRASIDTVKEQARAQAEKLKAVQPNIEAFVIAVGQSLRTARHITKPIKINKQSR